MGARHNARGRRTASWIAALLLPALAAQAENNAVYRWTDESGALHYSQWPPDDSRLAVERRPIESTNAPDYDPEAYRYSVQNQAERIGAAWDAIREEKEQEANEDRLTRAEARLAELEARAIRYPETHPVYASPYFLHRPHHRFRPSAPGRLHGGTRPRPPARPPGHDRPEPGPGWPGMVHAATTATPGFASPGARRP